MDRINTELEGDGGKQRREDIKRGGGIEEAARDQQHDVDDHKEDDRAAAGNVHHKALDRKVESCASEHIAEQRCAHGDEHDGSGGAAGVDEDILHLFQVDLMVDEHTDDQSVEYGDSNSLRRCKDAAVDAAENDDRHQQAPEGILERLEPFLRGCPRHHLEIHPAAEDQGRHDQTGAHHQARDHTRDKEIRDRRIRNGAVHHEGDRRRDHDTDRAARSHQRTGKRCRIARLHQRGDHDQAQCRDRCRA